nr:sugar ABC transporter permease [uncultured Butyricicoccus sp.]
MKRNKIWMAAFLAPAIVLFLLIYAIPLVMVFGTSLFEYRLMPNRFEFIGIQNYIELLTTDPVFKQAFVNTILWILIHCTLHVFLGTLLAFILYKKPRGWKFVRVSYMIPNIISQSAIAMIFVNVFNPQYGVVNSVLGALGLEQFQHNWLFEQATAFPSVTMTWLLFAGYTTTLVLSQCLSVDESILEAARVDGATGFQLDVFVMLPLVKKMIGTTVIMAASYMLQLFSLIYITTGGGPQSATTNLPLMLYQTAMKENNYGYANTIGVFIIVLGVVSMVLINKAFRMNESDY